MTVNYKHFPVIKICNYITVSAMFGFYSVYNLTCHKKYLTINTPYSAKIVYSKKGGTST